MFDFLRGAGMRRPSTTMRHALEANGLPHGTDFSALGVVESPGTYAGRQVTYFRVFDVERAARCGVDLFAKHAYQDFTTYGLMDLVLRAGFVEQDGTIVLYSRPPNVQAGVASEAAEPRRAPNQMTLAEAHS